MRGHDRLATPRRPHPAWIPRIGRPARTRHRPEARRPPPVRARERDEPANGLEQGIAPNQERPPGCGRLGQVMATDGRWLAPCGFHSELPQSMQALCPGGQSRRQGGGARAAPVLLELQGWQRPRLVSPGQPRSVAQPRCRDEAPGGSTLVLVRCLAAAAAPPTKVASCRPRVGWDLPRNSAVCGMQERRGWSEPSRLPMLTVFRLARSWQEFPVRQSRWAQAVSAQQQARAPQPTPLDWNGKAQTPSWPCLQAARVCRKGRWAKRDLAESPASQVKATGQPVSPAWARSIQQGRLPEAVSGEVQVTFG